MMPITAKKQNDLDRIATAILNGITVHMPNVKPDQLELILARAARMHRDKHDLEEAQRIAEIEEENRTSSIALARKAQLEEAERLFREEEDEKRRREQHDARMANLRDSLRDKPIPGAVKRRRPKYANLHDEIRALIKENPEIQSGEAYRHFQGVYGEKFLSIPGWKYYWIEVRGYKK